MPMPCATYSLVIPTFERAQDLELTLAGIRNQIHPPIEVLVVDSSPDGRSKEVCERWQAELPIQWLPTDLRSAAKQRNEGAERTSTAAEIIGFVDDDITLHPDACARVCEEFGRDDRQSIGGIAVRIEEIVRPKPSLLSRAYYRIQSGYRDETYGGRLFGPAINCLPCYTERSENSMIRGEWLNTGCVFYRRAVFLREKFPAFEGYSFMEDVHCSARIAKTHELYFHTEARCNHRDGTNSLKSDQVSLARQRLRNQEIVSRDVLGMNGFSLHWRLLLHRLFVSFNLLRRRETGWRDALQGTWT